MTALFFATHEEAHSLLVHTNARLLPENRGCYECDLGYIVITGIGPFAAAIATSIVLTKPIQKIYNFGIAGALHPLLAPGSIHAICKVAKQHWYLKEESEEKCSVSAHHCTEIEFPEIQEGLSLLTCDKPIYEQKALGYDLVDMEGYAIAWVGLKAGIPCQLYKLVSDHCNESSSALIKKNLQQYSELLAESVRAVVQ